MPFLAMTRGGVALRHAPVSRTSRPVRVCGARSQAGRNDSSAKERAPVELPLPLQRRGMLLAAVGAALVLPQPQPATAAGNSSKAFVSMAFEVLEETMTVPWGLTLQAVLHDAGTFNPGDNTGGLNGSIRFELERPENQRLATVVAQVEAARRMIDASALTRAPISFSDTLALAGLVQSASVFKASLCSRGKDGTCEVLYNAYGNKPPNARFGRLDSSLADSAGLIPAPGASASDFKAMFKRMGMTLGDLCVLSPALTGDYESSIALLQADAECAKVLASLEKSKRDMTRTSYEVPFFRAYLNLVAKGAKFEPTQLY